MSMSAEAVDEVEDVMCEDRRVENGSRRTMTVEPALLLLTFAITLTGPVLQNLVLTRMCDNNLGYNDTVCFNLTEFPMIEAQTQPKSAVLFMSKSLIEAVLPAILSFFIGPWSDHHGRKPLLVVPLLGHALLYAGYVVFSLDFARDWSIYWILLPSISLALSGGFVAFITGAFCYITDVSSADERAWRMGVAEASLLIGLPMGLASSSYVLAFGGYVLVFSLSSLVCILGFLYVLLLLPESVQPTCDIRQQSLLQGLLDKQLIVDMFKTCVKPRPGWRRGLMFLVMAALSSTIFTLNGEISVVFLYTREKFHWSIREYSLFSSITVIITTLGTLVGLRVFSSIMKLPDAPLSAFAFLTKAVSATTLALAPQPWILYLGSVFAVLGGLAAPLGRTILSKSVAKEDIGKVFSLASSIDALTPIAAAPLYTLIYNETFMSMSGAFFLLSAGIYVADVIIMCIVSTIQFKFPSTDYVLVSTDSSLN